MWIRGISIAAMGMFGATQAQAAMVVAEYKFASTTQAENVADGIDAGDVGWSDGLINGGVGGVGSKNLSFRTSATTDSESGALNGDDYVTFTITPDAGSSIQLDTFSFDYGYDRNNQGSATAYFFLQTSVGGFGAGKNVGSTYSVTMAGSPAPRDENASNTTNPAISLAALGTISSPVEFRVYMYDTINSNSAFVRLDNFVLTASVIPEPATLAFSGLGALVLLARRRSSEI